MERSMPVLESYKPEKHITEGHLIVLNEMNVEELVRKFLWDAARVDGKFIRIVKCAVSLRDKKTPVISVEISKHAFDNCRQNNNAKNNSGSIWDIDENNYSNSGHEGKGKIPQAFYNALRNKAFYGNNDNLIWDRVERKENINGKKESTKYFRISLNPRILFAYIFNINLANPLFKVSAAMERMVTDSNSKKKTIEEAERIEKLFREYKNEELTLASMYVAFTEREWVYTDENNETHRTNGFHYTQLKYVYGDPNKKKNKNRD